MKLEFDEPTMEVVLFTTSDVIATSGERDEAPESLGIHLGE